MVLSAFQHSPTRQEGFAAFLYEIVLVSKSCLRYRLGHDVCHALSIAEVLLPASSSGGAVAADVCLKIVVATSVCASYV